MDDIALPPSGRSRSAAFSLRCDLSPGISSTGVALQYSTVPSMLAHAMPFPFGAKNALRIPLSTVNEPVGSPVAAGQNLWSGERPGETALVFVLISVPSVSLFASTVHLFTAKRLHPAAQGRRASRRTLGYRFPPSDTPKAFHKAGWRSHCDCGLL